MSKKKRRQYAYATEKNVRLANHLRGRPTRTEIQMRKLLRRLKWRFCFQFPLGGYVPDFIFVDRQLIVEVDGSSHKGREAYDAMRDSHLSRYGYKVLRIPDTRLASEESKAEVLKDVSAAFWKAEKCFKMARFKYFKMDCVS